MVLNNTGLVYHGQGQLLLARAAHERSLSIRRIAFGEDHPAVSVALANIGLVEASMGDLDSAQDSLTKAVHRTETTLGAQHRDTGETLTALGYAYALAGHHAKALQAWSTALDVLQLSYAPTNPRLALLQELTRGTGEAKTLETSGPLACGLERYSALFITS
jgi:tetratricopeptide (TPR) repeat protein